jgi:uncharacterized membrane protein YphA (DoxX/SURF4 family)
MGAICLKWGDFILGQPVPKTFPGRTALAYAAGVFMVAAGAVVQWRRTAAWAAAALTAYYTLIVLILMNGRPFLAHYAEYGEYEGLAEQLAITAGALIVYATSTRKGTQTNIQTGADAAQANHRAALLTRTGQLAFGVSALIFGGAHFIYMNLTAPLVPKWLPPTQIFWGYLTGAAFLAAGIALLTGIRARLAAILLTGMLASFTLLVHMRILLGDHSSRMNWTELSINVTILGAAWVVADSLAPARPQAKPL